MFWPGTQARVTDKPGFELTTLGSSVRLANNAPINYSRNYTPVLYCMPTRVQPRLGSSTDDCLLKYLYKYVQVYVPDPEPATSVDVCCVFLQVYSVQQSWALSRCSFRSTRSGTRSAHLRSDCAAVLIKQIRLRQDNKIIRPARFYPCLLR